MMLKYLLMVPLLFSAQCFAAEKVLLATYYPEGPWYYPGDRGKGINAVLANKLTGMSHGRYQFESLLVPRKRLELLLETDQLLIAVPWVHPRFFNDLERTRYLWTGPLMEDTSLIVSPMSAPLEYNGPESLRGKRFAAPAGHQFPDLQSLIASKDIVRVEVPHVGNALRMMLAERQLDFAVVDKSTLTALKSDPLIDQSRLHLAKRPRTATYERSVLVPARSPALHAFLKQAVAELSVDDGWIDLAMLSPVIKLCYAAQAARDAPADVRRWLATLAEMGAQTGAGFDAVALPWPSCLAALQSGKMAGAIGVAYSKELAPYLVYPEVDGAADVERRLDSPVKPPFLVFGRKFYAQNAKEVRAIWHAIPKVNRSRVPTDKVTIGVDAVK
ncbi:MULTISPECIES: hypothetical protein [unclassified Janthinobacterium]|uniref:hypothetical protein n=1 Tax=unclassified Janthinobacterium TaxID=2610881 RepID=UPI00034964A4|nr:MULTISPECIES: hypothetical protein [unclassified Janthinobacterium]MEC5161988.1 hypothetical protein [Janthinobacterium sp. CG_S6]